MATNPQTYLPTRILASFLAILLVLSALSVPAIAAEKVPLTEQYLDSNGEKMREPVESDIKESKAPKIENYLYQSQSVKTEQIYSKNHITYIIGYPDKHVRVENNMTRAEAVTALYRLYDGTYPRFTQRMSNDTFNDVDSNDWYYKEIETLYNVGVIENAVDGAFRPNDPITRAEFAILAARYDQLEYLDKGKFSDVKAGHWAYGQINAAAEKGWIEGYPDGTFKPDQSITRGEVMALVNRLFNRPVTLEELPKNVNPYKDITESHWAYCDAMEATIKHDTAAWHGMAYNEGKINLVTERFVDPDGKEIKKPVVSEGKKNNHPNEVKGYSYVGYLKEITYVYSQGQPIPKIEKKVSKAKTEVGDTVTYSMTLSNGKKATDAWRDVTLTDEIPEHMSFVHGSVYLDGKIVEYTYEDGVLKVPVGKIESGKSVKVVFDATVTSTGYGKTVVNTATGNGSNGGPVEDSDDGTVIAQGDAQPTLIKTVDKKTAKVSDTITYTIKASNEKSASADLKNVKMEDIIPSDLTLSNGSVQVDGVTAQYAYDNQTKLLSVALGNIAPGATKTVTFECTVNATAYGKTIQNTAILKADDLPEVPGTDEGISIEDGKAALLVEKAVDQSVAKVGDTLNYTVKASNDSTAEVNLKNAIMQDALSEFVTFTHGSVQVDGFSAKYSYDNDSKLLKVDLGDIAPGQTKMITFAVVVNSTAYGKSFKNTAILEAENAPKKPGTDGGVTIENGNADGQIVSKQVSKAAAKVGETLTYTIQLKNSSAATAEWSGMTVTDVIPDGLTFAGNVQKNGSATTEYGYDAGTRTLTLQPVPIQPGEKASFTFDVTVDDGTQGRHIVNTAILEDNGEKTPIPDTGVTIDAGDTLPSVTKKADVTEAKIGDVFWYTVTVKNGAKATAAWKNIRFTDTLPAEVELVGGVLVDGTTVLHSQSGNVISVPLDDLAPGESYEITFRVQLMHGVAGSKFQNVAVVEGDNGKSTGTDKGVKIPETLEPESPNTQGKKVTKDVDKTVVKVGDNINADDNLATFIIDIVNNSKADWENVRIEDFINTQKVTLIDDTVFIDGQKMASKQNWNIYDGKFTTSLGTIKAGTHKTVQFTLKFTNDNEDKSKYVNHVTVISDEQTMTASSPEIIIEKPYPIPPSDLHYRLVHGSWDGVTNTIKWEPQRNIFLEELSLMAYRLMTNDYKKSASGSGTTTVPAFVSLQYRAEESEAISFFIRNNVLPAGVFDKTTNTVVTTSDGIDHVEGTQAQLTALMTFATGKNAGLTGNSPITRIEAARQVCKLTGRDESPNTGSYALAQFADVAATEKTIVEVSNTHAYTLDSYGSETWVYDSAMKN